MYICLINPPLTSSLYSEWDLSTVDSVSPPIGLLLLAAIVRQKGHEVSVIDAYAQGLSAEATAKYILAKNPDVVGLTATTPSIHGAAEVANRIKTSNPELRIVIGGAHITAVPQETFELFPQFDIGVIGEGEETFVELLDVLSCGRDDLRSVKGIIYRENGNIFKTERRPFLTDLDSLPLPAWDLLPLFTSPYRMSIVGTTSDKSTAIVTSRGCPGRCTFCDTSVFGKRFRGYSADYVIGMIEHLIANYGIEDFLIYDDNFVTDRKKLMRICQTLIERKYNISWSCCSRVNMVNLEILTLMKKAGCWQIEYGIESGSPKILEMMNKKITIECVRQALGWTKEAGIMTRGNFIFGYLGETKETLQETLNLILDIELDYFQQTFLTPYPGSEVYLTAAKYGEVNLDWTKMNNLAINFIPNGLSEEDLIRFSKVAFRKFYLRPKVIWAQLKRIRSLRDLKRLLAAFFSFIRTVFR